MSHLDINSILDKAFPQESPFIQRNKKEYMCFDKVEFSFSKKFTTATFSWGGVALFTQTYETDLRNKNLVVNDVVGAVEYRRV